MFSVLVALAATTGAQTQSFMLFRMLGVEFLLSDVVASSMKGAWGGSEFWLLVLIAEYAATIRTLPPQVSEQSQPNHITHMRSDRAQGRSTHNNPGPTATNRFKSS